MSVQDVIALAVVAVAAVYAGRSLWRTLHGETGCAGECGSKHASEEAAPRRTLRRVPLVSLDEIGKPAPPPRRAAESDAATSVAK